MSHYQHGNFSSSEELTESQGFNKFLNADNSDDEDEALQKTLNKKLQNKGGFGAKPQTGAANYQGSQMGGYPSSYGASNTYGSQFGQGYGAYSSGYGTGGAGTGYNPSGSGYGGSKPGGGSGYGSGFGGGTYGGGYSGFDATGYGGYGGYGQGSGFGGGGSGYGGTGYSTGGFGAMGGGEASGGDAYAFDIDLDAVKKRKEAQKAAKIAEEKKAEEERKKAEAEREKAQKNPKSNLKSGIKNAKGKGVSFDFDKAVPDDSDNENNKTISEIHEQDDEEEDHRPGKSEMQKAYKGMQDMLKKTDSPINSSGKILDFSDSEDKREQNNKQKQQSKKQAKKADSDSKDDSSRSYEEPKPVIYDSKLTNKLAESTSYEEVTKEMANAKKDKDSDKFKESHDSSYPEDFEASLSPHESSSKFGGSTELARGISKEAANRRNESKPEERKVINLMKDDKPAKSVTIEAPKQAAIRQDDKAPVLADKQYQTQAAKDYVYESLLKDEKRKAMLLETQLNSDTEQLKTVNKLLEEKNLSQLRLETLNQNLQHQLDMIKEELAEAKQHNATFVVENEELRKRLDIFENKMLELENQKKTLKAECDGKTLLLQERKELLEKNFETRTIADLKRQHETEKELLVLKIEDLKAENQKNIEEITKLEEELFHFKGFTKNRFESEAELKKLKIELITLQAKLREREEAKQANQIEKNDIANQSNGIPLIDKEMQMQELLIKGFQKENEKFVAENKNLRKEIEGLQERLFNENKKVNEFRTKLVHNTNNVLLTDYEVDIETRKALGGENVISRKELNEANEKIAKLQNELASRESLHQNRELELKYELDRLRAQKMDLEAKLGGVDLSSIKTSDEEYRQLERVLEETRRNHELEIKDLKNKLNWYIETQVSLNSKDEVIKAKDLTIRKLEEEIGQLLADPKNYDKSGQTAKIMAADKKRIKQLENDVANLEDALKKRNPTGFKQIKDEKDESSTLKELKAKIAELTKEKDEREKEYETKIHDMRQNLDKMKLGYEKRLNDSASKSNVSRPLNDSASKSNVSRPVTKSGDEEVEALKLRIKELEREVDDSKKYYLNKAKQLKEASKRPPTPTSANRPKTATMKELPKNNHITVEDQENKENENNVTIEEKYNVVRKLLGIHHSILYKILSAFQDYREQTLAAFDRNDHAGLHDQGEAFKTMISELIDPHHSDIIQRKCEKIVEEAVSSGVDPNPCLSEIQRILFDLTWEEMRKQNSRIATSGPQQTPRVNNYFNNESQDQTQAQHGHLEEVLNRTVQELEAAKDRLERFSNENSRLFREKAYLEQIIKRLPKNPTSVDFATMEKRLEVMERNYRENEIELRNAFKKVYNYDPFGLTDTEIGRIKTLHAKEIEQFKEIIEQKNKEIGTFRKEMEIILRELESLKRGR